MSYAAIIKDPARRPYPLAKEEVARLYYEEEFSLPEVAARAGTSRQRLARWMEYWQLPRRTRFEGKRIYVDKHNLPRSPNWQGGKWKMRSTDTWYTYAPGHPRKNHSGAVPTHVLAAEGRIGRWLEQGEVVHHLDRDRDNNDPENLCVMLRADHSRLHRLLGAVGIRLLMEGRSNLVLGAIDDQQRRRLVEAVYVEGAPCVVGLVSERAGSRSQRRKYEGGHGGSMGSDGGPQAYYDERFPA